MMRNIINPISSLKPVDAKSINGLYKLEKSFDHFHKSFDHSYKNVLLLYHAFLMLICHDTIQI